MVDLACAGIWAPDFHILLSESSMRLLCVVLFRFRYYDRQLRLVSQAINHT